MTATRDPDRLIRAWLELMSSEAPDRAIAAVLQATETTRQVRAIPRIGRWRLPMNRLTLIATAVIVIVALAGGAYLIGSGSQGVASPTAAPTATPGPTQPQALAPATLRSTWVADAAPIAGLGNIDRRLRLVVNEAGDQLSVVINGATKAATTLSSGASARKADELDLVASAAAAGCAGGDTGRYTTTVSSDGLYLTLKLVSDACATRGATLARTWVRSHDGASPGGRAILSYFEPAFLITLPTATYQADPETTDGAWIASTDPNLTLTGVRNPAGYADPCAGSSGSRIQVAHTIKAFSAYLDALPGFTVQSTTLQIDGHAAAHLEIPTTITADCPSGDVYEWTQGDVVATGGWHLHQGETDGVYLIEVGSDLYLLQWFGADVTSADALSVISTVHFVNGLPSGS